MKCEIIREQLSAWLDGELPENEAAEVAGHIAECGECRRELRSLENIKGMLAGLPGLNAPPEILDAVMGEFESPARAERRRVGMVRRFWPAAAAALIALVCLVAYRPERETREAVGVAYRVVSPDAERMRDREDISRERLSEVAPSSATPEKMGDDYIIDPALQPRDEEWQRGGAVMASAPEALLTVEIPATQFALHSGEPETAVARVDEALLAVGGIRVSPAPATVAMRAMERVRIMEDVDALEGDRRERPAAARLEEAPASVLRVRVPADKYDDFVAGLDEIGALSKVEAEPAVGEEVRFDGRLGMDIWSPMREPIAEADALEEIDALGRLETEEIEFIELTIEIIAEPERP